MKKVFASYRNAVWLLALAVCLLFLWVGFIIVAVRPYDGDKQADALDLSQLNIVDAGTAQVSPVGSGILQELPKSKNAGQDYLNSLYFLCDASVSGLAGSGLAPAGQVWLGENGHISAGNLANCSIVYSNDGAVVSPAQAAMVAKPAILVICIGQEGLGATSQDNFINGYTAMVQSIQAASPDTRIILCPMPSVTTAYNGGDLLSGPLLSNAAEWVKTVSIQCGVYYGDTNKDITSAGYLLSEYAATDGKTLNLAGLQKFTEYLQTHALK